MGFYVVIRGPLGSGKSTLSRRLTRLFGGEHIAIDQILVEYGLEEWEEGYISEKSFLRANRIAIKRANPPLRRGIPVIFDGNFYWESALSDLLARLPFPHVVITLKVSLETCVSRDAGRNPPHGPDAAKEVYEKATAFEYGISVDADGSDVGSRNSSPIFLEITDPPFSCR